MTFYTLIAPLHNINQRKVNHSYCTLRARALREGMEEAKVAPRQETATQAWEQFRNRILQCNAAQARPGFAQEHVKEAEKAEKAKVKSRE